MHESGTKQQQTGRARGRGLGCGLLLAGALLVVGGLGYAAWTWISSPRASDEPMRGSAVDGACSWPRQYFPDQPAYDGPGPHPVEVLIEQHGASGSYYREMLLVGTSRLGRVPEYLEPRDESSVQLLACLDQTEEGRQVKMCSFDSGAAVPLYEATYEVTVYEARTGDEIGTATIPKAVSDSCPMFMSYDSNDEPKLYTEPSATQVSDALVSFAETP